MCYIDTTITRRLQQAADRGWTANRTHDACMPKAISWESLRAWEGGGGGGLGTDDGMDSCSGPVVPANLQSGPLIVADLCMQSTVSCRQGHARLTALLGILSEPPIELLLS